ncbi:proline racemase family protein [Thalassovita aquimarina]|uniref:Proline racemase family protein n=1 Tax=Thalassovita aquimarina TaxID=2785917 RepID=A0ABS5HQZ4_9RHOB|nr:proline racemase family protein [Thalassovita aquimarina]MBR9651376.1 proline racemase family protein [Thalassovita aquimarina]
MRVIDSHTGGEPTRLIVGGGPALGAGPLAERALRLARQHGDFCASVLLEPRGHDAVVGALLVPATVPDCVTGVIFFNPVGPLGMCGHATIGTAVTLAHLGHIEPGLHRIETPVGVVEVDLHDANTASVVNVESYRLHKDVTVDVEGLGPVTGDVAWGGNWFFLTEDAPVALEIANIGALSAAALKVRQALQDAGITGADGAWIDHVEFTGPARSAAAQGRNFVLCPGGAYDRSPCGTGTSAKLACLAANGLLAPGEDWLQESIIGSTYRLSYRPGVNGGIVPTVTGQAFVTAQAELLFDPADPYARGIRP